jgi:hypothetical protein
MYLCLCSVFFEYLLYFGNEVVELELLQCRRSDLYEKKGLKQADCDRTYLQRCDDMFGRYSFPRFFVTDFIRLGRYEMDKFYIGGRTAIEHPL